MKKFLLALALCLLPSLASAQCNGVFAAHTVCGNSTGSAAIPGQIPQSAVTGLPGGSSGQIEYNNAGAFGGFTLAGDCTASIPNITCTKVNGVTYGSSPSTDTVAIVDSANHTTYTAVPNCTGGMVQYATSTHTFTCGPFFGTGGRLTIQIGGGDGGIPSQDITAQGSLAYVPCAGWVSECTAGPFIPIYDGTNFRMRQFTASNTSTVGLSLTLNTGAQLSGNLYDVFIGDNSGTLTMCTGPAWTNSGAGTSARGTGAGTTQIAWFLNIPTNAVSMTCKFGASNFTCAVNQCTQIGTMFATGNGQTSVQIHPAATSLGPNSIVGICNTFNRVHISAKAQDSTSTWSYASATGRNANNSNANRIRYIDCIGSVQPRGRYTTSWAPAVSSATAVTTGIGFNLDCTIAGQVASGGGGAGAELEQSASNATSIGSAVHAQYSPYPVLGLNYVQACEQATTVTATFFGNDFMQLVLDFEM